jgi:hypothetical protein
MKIQSIICITFLWFISKNAYATTYEWGFLIYMNADNSLSETSLSDVNEMEEIDYTLNNNVCVAVQLDRKGKGKKNEGNDKLLWKGGRQFLVKHDTDTNKVSSNLIDLGEIDMGSWSNLVKFINWSSNQCKAKKYAFILWSHGDGIKSKLFNKGVSPDDTSKSILSIDSLVRALKKSNIKKFEIVGFDACLMQMIEVSYSLKDITSYVVASVDSEDGNGWKYNGFLKWISDGNIESIDITKKIIEETVTQKKEQNIISTLSVIDTSQIEKYILKIIELINLCKVNNSILEKIDFSLEQAIKFNSPAGEDYMDFFNFITILKKNLEGDSSYNSIIDKINEILLDESKLILFNKFWYPEDDRMDSTHGLSIYVPEYWFIWKPYKKTNFYKKTKWSDFLILIHQEIYDKRKNDFLAGTLTNDEAQDFEDELKKIITNELRTKSNIDPFKQIIISPPKSAPQDIIDSLKNDMALDMCQLLSDSNPKWYLDNKKIFDEFINSVGLNVEECKTDETDEE